MNTERVIAFELRQVDLLKARVDVVALKYARSFHGADRAVAEAFSAAGKPTKRFELGVDDYVVVQSDGVIRAPQVMFIGAPTLSAFRYKEIRRFSAQVLTILAREVPDVKTVAMTLHGPGYGLDIVESARQQFLGVTDAIDGGSYPEALEKVVIVERMGYRLEAAASAIQAEFEDAIPPPGWKPAGKQVWPIYPVPPAGSTRAKAPKAIRAAVSHVTGKPETKLRVFVAMPFTRRMRDVWRFGIRDPVRRAGYLCERMDEEFFTGGIIERIKRSIEEADLVIADLTGDNPNVFLEVGYAWGRQRPTLFLCREQDGERPDIPFDVASHRCLFYEDATDLEEQITRYLEGSEDLTT